MLKKILIIISAFFVFFTISFIILVNLVYNGIIWFNTPDKNKFPVKGIDVSHHQGDIDWNKIKEHNISFTFIKATEGDDFKDRKFRQNWENAKNAGIARGAYHYYSLRFSGKEQAGNFIDSVPKEINCLPPVIDLEFGGNSKKRPSKYEFQRQLDEYIFEVKEYYGKEPILYVTYDFYKYYLAGKYDNYNLWVRDLFKKPYINKNVDWTFWQYCNKGRLKGIEGFVDLNVFNGNLDELKKFLND